MLLLLCFSFSVYMITLLALALHLTCVSSYVPYHSRFFHNVPPPSSLFNINNDMNQNTKDEVASIGFSTWKEECHLIGIHSVEDYKQSMGRTVIAVQGRVDLDWVKSIYWRVRPRNPQTPFSMVVLTVRKNHHTAFKNSGSINTVCGKRLRYIVLVVHRGFTTLVFPNISNHKIISKGPLKQC